MLTFKILVIQTINTLSDERTEYLINDWLSFMRFLGLGLSDRVPDAKTIWLFRERLTKAGAIATLFEHFDRTLREAGYIPMSGQIVNASLVATPRRRNTNAEKADIKAGRIPEHWKNNPAKLRHKDCDTRWTLKFTKASRWRMARCRQSISPFRPFGYIRARFLVHLSDFTTDHSPAQGHLDEPFLEYCVTTPEDVGYFSRAERTCSASMCGAPPRAANSSRPASYAR